MTFESARVDLLEELDDLEFFQKFVKFQYANICFSETRIRPIISDYNLHEAYASYVKDEKELREKENMGKPLKRVKKVAFISYWLRRVSPITAVVGSINLLEEQNRTEKENLLFKYANEFCAFDLGFRICRYIESRKEENTNGYVRTSKLSEKSELGESDIREYMLNVVSSYTLPYLYITDICECLKEKSLSPHALYFIYVGLFTRLQR